MSKCQPGGLTVISGPSGVGKSTLIAEVLRQRPDLYFSVSFTTRKPRPGEVNGVNYHFVDVPEFERMIAAGELLEYARYSGNYYGTSAKLIDEHLNAGTDVLLDIEVVGSGIVREKRPGTPMIFIAPPSFEVLAQRLRGRGTDDESVIQTRLNRAKEELREAHRYDYIVINKTNGVAECAAEVLSILKAEQCRTAKRAHLIDAMLAEPAAQDEKEE